MSADESVADPLSTLDIQNVVVSSSIGHEIDLSSVGRDLEGADFDPERFAGVIYRPEGASATSMLFRSGKMTCTGAGSVKEANETVDATVDALQELGIPAESAPVTTQNIVSDADLGTALNLGAIAIGLGLETVEYEPV